MSDALKTFLKNSAIVGATMLFVNGYLWLLANYGKTAILLPTFLLIVMLLQEGKVKV